MAFVQIFEDDQPFDWQPKDDLTGQVYESVFKLRLIADHEADALRRKYDQPDAFTDALVDAAITGWTGVTGAFSKQDVPCTSEMKRRLPTQWKVQILRMCASHLGDDRVARAQEKKTSRRTSSGRKTT